MYASVLISLACSLAGLWISTVLDVPCSALIVLLMAATFIVGKSVKMIISR